MANEDLLKLTITELAPRIRAGEVSPVELTEAALARAERLQPHLNSFITILHDQARSPGTGTGGGDSAWASILARCRVSP